MNKISKNNLRINLNFKIYYEKNLIILFVKKYDILN